MTSCLRILLATSNMLFCCKVALWTASNSWHRHFSTPFSAIKSSFCLRSIYSSAACWSARAESCAELEIINHTVTFTCLKLKNKNAVTDLDRAVTQLVFSGLFWRPLAPSIPLPTLPFRYHGCSAPYAAHFPCCAASSEQTTIETGNS